MSLTFIMSFSMSRREVASPACRSDLQRLMLITTSCMLVIKSSLKLAPAVSRMKVEMCLCQSGRETQIETAHCIQKAKLTLHTPGFAVRCKTEERCLENNAVM